MKRRGEYFTVRQAEMIRLVAAGWTNAQIGARMGITEGTTRFFLTRIYARLGLYGLAVNCRIALAVNLDLILSRPVTEAAEELRATLGAGQRCL